MDSVILGICELCKQVLDQLQAYRGNSNAAKHLCQRIQDLDIFLYSFPKTQRKSTELALLKIRERLEEAMIVVQSLHNRKRGAAFCLAKAYEKTLEDVDSQLSKTLCDASLAISGEIIFACSVGAVAAPLSSSAAAPSYVAGATSVPAAVAHPHPPLSRVNLAPGAGAELPWWYLEQDKFKHYKRHDRVLRRRANTTVYLGELHNGTKVAIKDFERCTADERHMLTREMDICAGFAHPCVLSTLGGWYPVDDRSGYAPCALFEYRPGGTLRRALLHDDARLRSDHARVQVMLDVARGMAYLHHIQRVSHCNLRSENVLLSAGAHAKVFDFGAARFTRPKINGANEQVSCDKSTTLHSDVRSFGVMLWEVLMCGDRFVHSAEHPSIGELVNRVRECKSSACDSHGALQVNAEAAGCIASLVSRCLKPDAAEQLRFGDIVLELEKVQRCVTPHSATMTRTGHEDQVPMTMAPSTPTTTVPPLCLPAVQTSTAASVMVAASSTLTSAPTCCAAPSAGLTAASGATTPPGESIHEISPVSTVRFGREAVTRAPAASQPTSDVQARPSTESAVGSDMSLKTLRQAKSEHLAQMRERLIRTNEHMRKEFVASKIEHMRTRE